MISLNSHVARLATTAATPPALTVGVYLLFAGHNQPGGGFAAGLVFGSVLALQRMTGIHQKGSASVLLTAGTLLIVATAAAPLMWGDVLLDQAVVDTELPVLGKVKSGTALPFDIGVTLVVLGLVAALFDGLGMTQGSEDPT